MKFGKHTIFKVAELVIAVIAICLHFKTFTEDVEVPRFDGPSVALFVITATYAGFLIITLGTFIEHVLGHPINKNTDLFFCIIGAILYIVSGSISIYFSRESWFIQEGKETTRIDDALGSLAIIQGIIFIGDAYFIFKTEMFREQSSYETF